MPWYDPAQGPCKCITWAGLWAAAGWAGGAADGFDWVPLEVAAGCGLGAEVGCGLGAEATAVTAGGFCRVPLLAAGGFTPVCMLQDEVMGEEDEDQGLGVQAGG